jgi:hypothetical protein
MPEKYPLTLPQPLLTPYGVEVDSGLLRTPMDGGLSRQRRLYDVMPHAFTLEFVVPRNQLYSWQDWINRYGYDYIEMDLVSWLSVNQDCSTHYVRLTTNIAYEMLDSGRHVRARMGAELSPAQVSNYSPPPSDLWVIGGSPPFPSASAGPVIAGTPGNPSIDVIHGGTPDNPSL